MSSGGLALKKIAILNMFVADLLIGSKSNSHSLGFRSYFFLFIEVLSCEEPVGTQDLKKIIQT